MPQPTKSGPDPSKPIPSPTGLLGAQPSDANFETDFVDLTALFTAASGGNLSPELSADLALEIVLNEVVEQACLATGATGAAIVLQRGGEMVCRATSGSTAPDLGSRLDTTSGLSGECIRTREIQRCDDVQVDGRVDVNASQRLGVRSVIVMPLIVGTELVGVFELFSSLPRAFGQRDDLTLQALAGRILSNLERAAKPLPPPADEPLPAFERVQANVLDNLENTAARGFDWSTWLLGAAVFVCAVLLGVLLVRHVVPRNSTRLRHSTTPRSAAENSSVVVDRRTNADASRKHEGGASVAAPEASLPKSNGTAVPPGGLLVLENGREVFRLPPAQIQDAKGVETGLRPASAVEGEEPVELAPEVAAGSLIFRVEPEYPEDARQQRIQGTVVLDAHISEDGAVRDVQVVSGPPPLVPAATNAVKQWRFNPRTIKGGGAAEMQIRITLNFRLPQNKWPEP
jgi:TonB family protein